MSGAITPGFHGKLPAKGDFLTRRLPRAFVNNWDGWLQKVIASSKESLGSDWLEVYLNSPIWRFALSNGTGDEDQSWAGVLMPSVDRVGRYFPLTIAVTMGQGLPFAAVEGGNDWYGTAEELALSALDEESFDLDSFSDAVAELGACVFSDTADEIDVSQGASLGLDDVEQAGQFVAPLMAGFVRACYPAYSVWWTTGSERIAPCLCVIPGLPDTAFYTSMLAGDWQGELGDDQPAAGDAPEAVI
ncbi:MAG: type VI secretion system-associated protein TagF [Gammaproteobacteria bacterium]|nr:type VI secretion system-associated protein TagF [Gammaproteobacteria bacterium]